MALPVDAMIGTGLVALAFAAIFLAGEHIHPLRALIRDRRSIVSFTAGMSAAYVFVHLMPELHEARLQLVESASETVEMHYEGIAIYFVALIGFLCFYGLDQVRAKSVEAAEAGGKKRFGNLHLFGMAAYVALMSYLLVRGAGDGTAATVVYAVAFGGHFLALEHSLREEYEEAFRSTGRWLMAASCLFGWAVGVFLGVPMLALALLVAFISGGVIMTNTLMELSDGKDGRFLPFMLGSLLYGLILIPLG